MAQDTSDGSNLVHNVTYIIIVVYSLRELISRLLFIITIEVHENKNALINFQLNFVNSSSYVHDTWQRLILVGQEGKLGTLPCK